MNREEIATLRSEICARFQNSAAALEALGEYEFIIRARELCWKERNEVIATYSEAMAGFDRKLREIRERCGKLGHVMDHSDGSRCIVCSYTTGEDFRH